MIVAGIGFRTGAPLSALREALVHTGAQGIAALATLDSKADAPALRALASELNLPVLSIAPDALAAQQTLTRSARITQTFGTGSLAEAAALAGAGPGARLRGPRAVSADRTATAAIAERNPT